jgi:hypothetical protein
MFVGNPVGDRAAKKIIFCERARYASYRQRERKLNCKAGNGPASWANFNDGG